MVKKFPLRAASMSRYTICASLRLYHENRREKNLGGKGFNSDDADVNHYESFLIITYYIF